MACPKEESSFSLFFQNSYIKIGSHSLPLPPRSVYVLLTQVEVLQNEEHWDTSKDPSKSLSGCSGEEDRDPIRSLRARALTLVQTQVLGPHLEILIQEAQDFTLLTNP